MKKLKNTKVFFEEVGTEIKKTTWPARDELIESTIVVIISVILLSVFVGLSDKILELALKLLIR